MPIYPGRKAGTWRVTMWRDGRQYERTIKGARSEAESLLATMRATSSAVLADVRLDVEDLTAQRLRARVRTTEAEDMASWPKGPGVYFLQLGEDGPIKIGIATSIRSRCCTHQSSSPYRVYLRAVILGASRADEQRIHRRYAALRMRGEWFAPGLALLDAIARLPVREAKP